MADAARMLELYEGMRGQAGGIGEPARLEVGAISTVQATLLPRALQQFQASSGDPYQYRSRHVGATAVAG